MDEHGAVVPPNLVRGSFVHFSTDNVDINEATLDAKDTFHATQIAAWQRGPPTFICLMILLYLTHKHYGYQMP